MRVELDAEFDSDFSYFNTGSLSLVYLDMGRSRTRRPERVSNIIRRSFPRIETLKYRTALPFRHRNSDDDIDAWNMKEVIQRLGLRDVSEDARE